MEKNINLDAILEYEMKPLEAAAYKVCLAWCVLAPKRFPNRKIVSLRKKGDPRQSFLFRWAYKFVRETQGLIPVNEYNLYVKAQLDILSAIVDKDGRNFTEISPTCLAGDKAWIRWKIWKRKYDKIVKRGSSKEEVGLDVTPLADIIKELSCTKAFLIGRFDGIPKEEQILMAARDIERWVHLGKVSGYYAVLSPWVKKYCKSISIDLTLYKVTPEVQDNFNEQFAYELA